MGRPVDDELSRLRAENAALRAELAGLRGDIGPAPEPTSPNGTPMTSAPEWDGLGHGLTKDQVGRYSRQIVLPSFGAEGERVVGGIAAVRGAAPKPRTLAGGHTIVLPPCLWLIIIINCSARQAVSGLGADRWHGGPRLPRSPLSCRCRRRSHWAGGQGHGGAQQPAPPDHPRVRRLGPAHEVFWTEIGGHCTSDSGCCCACIGTCIHLSF
jgi:hypothetical protein